ncbi:MAG: hypothetical protein CMF42_05370 [Legionellales bacterium]|nr:hypothetical protein [Legionellales bacterium]OUX67111.1 MAG: hypothetical protein CBD38_03715 [bacterium TMED178]|tara:strand:+ start:2172 stop:2918 length:747 start_codon:yes stop_codon:yes gene_type:complete
MFVLLSPAKKLQQGPIGTTIPHFLEESLAIADKLKTFSHSELHQLLHTSQKITEQNIQRYQSFSKAQLMHEGSAAIMTYAGDVYRYFNPQQFDASEQEYIQSHFGIITGLYGLLRPFDKMLPYRLEMKNKLLIDNTLLTHYWHQRLAQYLSQERLAPNTPVIMLASNEYSAAIDNQTLNIIQVDFKERRDNTLKTIAVNAKRARGMMAAYIVKTKPQCIQDLHGFDDGGYRFVPDQSTYSHLLFVRDA